MYLSTDDNQLHPNPDTVNEHQHFDHTWLSEIYGLPSFYTNYVTVEITVNECFNSPVAKSDTLFPAQSPEKLYINNALAPVIDATH